MRWTIQHDLKKGEDIVSVLLANRGLTTKKDIEEFLHPSSPFNLTLSSVGVKKEAITAAFNRIKEGIENEEGIVIYGDYDADGICATAILWEALRDLGAKVMPFIPKREKEGYGLSPDGIDSLLADEKNQDPKLIIAVDSGIVAHEAVEYAKSKGLEVIVIDHHEASETLPDAYTIIHSQQLCASGLSFLFAKELLGKDSNAALELAAIATVTDLMPMLGPNRSIVKYGLEALNNTKRVGLRALFSVAGIEKVGTYELGYLIGPRINASGRIESALTALRMLCTPDFNKAIDYAQLLNETNRNRQTMTEEMVAHALNLTKQNEVYEQRIIVVAHESYHPGVIGLISGKLTEYYYLPSIVLSRGGDVSKASARSITGFNIIEAIREANDLLLGAGGHPMAAGFSIETTKIDEFTEKITQIAKEKVSPDMLERSLRIDCELQWDEINRGLYEKLKQFAPFGIGNPEPTFASELTAEEAKGVGQEGKHLKLRASGLDCIAFGKGECLKDVKIGKNIKVAYTLDWNVYNGRESLQLKVKDLVLSTEAVKPE